MAVAVDSASLFFGQLVKRLHPVRDALVLAGIYYTTKRIVSFGYDVYTGLRTFGISRLLASSDLSSVYGKWAVVTGCTQGIGEEYAYQLAKRKMNVILVSRNRTKLEKVAQKIDSESGVETELVVLDFSTGKSGLEESRLRETLRGKDIGILVNNVGVASVASDGEGPRFFDEISMDDLWVNVNVNVGACVSMTQIVLPQMIEKRRGAIINLGSIISFRPCPLLSVYAAAKAFVQYWSKSLAEETKAFNIDVLCLEPGPVCTRMTSYAEEFRQPGLMVATPSAYARSSIATLGWTQRTTGYWPHALLSYLTGSIWLPDVVWFYGFLRLRNNSPNVKQRKF